MVARIRIGRKPANQSPIRTIRIRRTAVKVTSATARGTEASNFRIVLTPEDRPYYFQRRNKPPPAVVNSDKDRLAVARHAADKLVGSPMYSAWERNGGARIFKRAMDGISKYSHPKKFWIEKYEKQRSLSERWDFTHLKGLIKGCISSKSTTPSKEPEPNNNTTSSLNNDNNSTSTDQRVSATTETSMSKEDQGSSSGSKSAIDMSDLYSKEIEELLQTDSEDELVPAEPYGNEDTPECIISRQKFWSVLVNSTPKALKLLSPIFANIKLSASGNKSSNVTCDFYWLEIEAQMLQAFNLVDT